jgi:hypothetical protein
MWLLFREPWGHTAPRGATALREEDDMRRLLGAGFLGLALLGVPALGAFADDPEGEPLPAMADDGSSRNLLLGAVVALVVIGGGIALARRS